MVDAEYDFIPANNSCKSVSNNYSIISTSGSLTEQNIINANAIENQHNENIKYDNITSMKVKPLYGGKNNNKIKDYEIIHNNITLKYKCKTIKEAINKFLSNYKVNNYLIEINEINDKNIKIKNKKIIKQSYYYIHK